MSRARIGLAVALLAAASLSACRAHAQPVAKLDVVKGSKQAELTQHQKLDEIRGQLGEVLQLLRGKPPIVEPPPPPPPGPTTPTDPTKPPAGDNPFIDWCARGFTFLEYLSLRNGGIYSEALEAQARAAGCFAPPKPGPITGGGSGPATGPTTGPGFDLGEGDGIVKVNAVTAGQALTFAFTRRASGYARIAVFGSPGAFFRVVTDYVNGAGEITIAGSGQLHEREVTGLPSGRHTYTVIVDGSGQLGVQLSQ